MGLTIRENIQKLLEEYDRTILLLFLVSTAFFIYQHSVNFSWDFSVYTLNARYYLGQSDYYELERPPLTSVIILLFSPIGWLNAEYIYIIFVSCLFCISSKLLARTLGIDQRLYYLFLMTPPVLLYGLRDGTELLSVSIVQLILYSVLRKQESCGIFAGLAFLTRYTNIIFLPLILFVGSKRKITKSIIFHILAVSPWLLANFWMTGNFFSSIGNSYALNVLYRTPQELSQDIWGIVAYFGVLTPLFVLGVIRSIKSHRLPLLISCAISFFTLVSYINTPLREDRYLITLAIPISVISTIRVSDLSKRYKKYLGIFVVLFLVCTSYVVGGYNLVRDTPGHYRSAISDMGRLGLDDCNILSNGYVPLNYFGRTSGIYPREDMLMYEINQGNHIVLFKFLEGSELSVTNSLDEDFVLLEKSDYIIFGKSGACNQIVKVEKPYTERIKDYFLYKHGETINTNPCFLLFSENSLMQRFCNLVNFRGFTIDENQNRG